MSMLYQMRRVSLEVAQSLSEDPSDILFFLSGYEPPSKPPGLLSRLFGPAQKPALKREWIEPARDSILDLGKAWHILHYLFCREAWEGPLPAATLLCAGHQLGDIDVGYGPARLLATQDLKAFLDFIDSLDESTFLDGIDMDQVRAAELYPGVPEQIEELRAYWEFIPELREFVRETLERQEAVVVHLY